MLISGILIGFVLGAAAAWSVAAALRSTYSRRDNEAVEAYMRRRAAMRRAG